MTAKKIRQKICEVKINVYICISKQDDAADSANQNVNNMKNIKDGVALILIFAAAIVGESPLCAAGFVAAAAVLQIDKIDAALKRDRSRDGLTKNE